jgi:hypothetical protein
VDPVAIGDTRQHACGGLVVLTLAREAETGEAKAYLAPQRI